MANPTLIPCLVQLRSEFNSIAPERDRASDGWIGDAAHQQETSDHNDDEVGKVPIHDADTVHEVHAVDVDVDLRESDLTMEKVVQFLLTRCRLGAENRLRYVIYNRRIWRASNGWRLEAYTGPSAHTEHAHFSASYTTSLEASTASWHLEDIPVALTPADKAAINDMVADRIVAAIPRLTEALTAAIPPAAFIYFRQQVKGPLSDTFTNLIEAEITEAVLAGQAVKRFPANTPKTA